MPKTYLGHNTERQGLEWTDFRSCSQLYFLYDALCYYHCYCLCTCIRVFLNLLFSHKSVTKLSVCHCKSNYYQHQHHRCHGYLRSFGTGDWCGLGWHIRGTLLAVADRKVLALDVSVVLTDYTASATKTLYIISIFQTQTTHWAFSYKNSQEIIAQKQLLKSCTQL